MKQTLRRNLPDLAFLSRMISLIRGTACAHMGRDIYGGEGAKHWKNLAENEPSYTVSRANRNLLLKSLDEISVRVPKGLTMIDLGPGSKTSVEGGALIATALSAKCYRIKEGSSHSSEYARRIARSRLDSSITVEAKVGDIFDADKDIDYPTIAYMGGGTICNLEHQISDVFPHEVLRETLKKLMAHTPFGWLLLSFDMTCDPERLSKMYGSEANAKLMCNIMHRAAAEFPQYALNPNAFRLDPLYIQESRQLAMRLTATSDQDCGFGTIIKGDKFHIINSYKIAPRWFESAVRELRYATDYRVLDEDTGTAIYLLRSPNAIR